MPFQPDRDSAIDPKKEVFLVVSPPLEYQNEKDSSYCVLYDVVAHPDELHSVSIDATGAARHRVSDPKP